MAGKPPAAIERCPWMCCWSARRQTQLVQRPLIDDLNHLLVQSTSLTQDKYTSNAALLQSIEEEHRLRQRAASPRLGGLFRSVSGVTIYPSDLCSGLASTDLVEVVARQVVC